MVGTVDTWGFLDVTSFVTAATIWEDRLVKFVNTFFQ